MRNVYESTRDDRGGVGNNSRGLGRRDRSIPAEEGGVRFSEGIPRVVHDYHNLQLGLTTSLQVIVIGSPSRIRTRVMASRVPYDGPLHQGTDVTRTRPGYFKKTEQSSFSTHDLKPEFTFSRLSGLGRSKSSVSSTSGVSDSPRVSVAVGTLSS